MLNRKQASGMALNRGVGLETWDFDACGKKFLGKDVPVKEAPSHLL